MDGSQWILEWLCVPYLYLEMNERALHRNTIIIINHMPGTTGYKLLKWEQWKTRKSQRMKKWAQNGNSYMEICDSHFSTLFEQHWNILIYWLNDYRDKIYLYTFFLCVLRENVFFFSKEHDYSLTYFKWWVACSLASCSLKKSRQLPRFWNRAVTQHCLEGLHP